ncbi:MAG: exodeoxyribonuclease VII large subunit [Pseudomonadota bacterium]
MDLFETTTQSSNAPEFTVSELSGAVKQVIEGEFGFVRVRGEIGRVSRPRSGHVYLDLKDDRAVLAGVIWKGAVRGLETQPEEGMEVIATGRLTTFPGNSRYQIIIEQIAPAGMGALMAMLEKRKAAFAAEGLFAAERKRKLPYLPEVIGVVTSPTGAVIRDILHRLAERFPRPVLLWPVPVQGEKSAPAVAAAIRGFNALPGAGSLRRPDVLIVARGGGSVEDLWGFNDEAVVRAVAESKIPVISAVGHETDTTLIDLVADRRAPTPTAAAEMAVPVRLDLIATLASLEERRSASIARGLSLRRQRVRDLGRALPRPETLLAERAQRLDALSDRLPRALVALARERHLQLNRGAAGRFGPHLLRFGLERQKQRIARVQAGLRLEMMSRSISRLQERLSSRAERLQQAGRQSIRLHRGRFEVLASTLSALGPASVLARGYVIVRDSSGAGDGAVLTRAAEVAAASRLELEFADGKVAAIPLSAEAQPRKPAPRRKTSPKQGSLF